MYYCKQLSRVKNLTVLIERELTSVYFDDISILRGKFIAYRVKPYRFYSHTAGILDVSFYMLIENRGSHKTLLKHAKFANSGCTCHRKLLKKIHNSRM